LHHFAHFNIGFVFSKRVQTVDFPDYVDS